MKVTAFILLSGFIVLSSCTKEPGSIADYQAAETQLAQGYSSPDPRLAEQALLSYRATFEKWQSQGVKRYDYDHVFGVTDARLMLLYEHLGDTAKADRFYQQATGSLALVSMQHGGEPKHRSRDYLASVIQKADAHYSLQWKQK